MQQLNNIRAPLSADQSDRRGEPRFSIGAQAMLKIQGDGHTYPAVTLNISKGGLLVKLAESSCFKVGDRVVCEIALADGPEQAFASWGIGTVVRVDELNAAVELRSAVFSSGDEI